MEPEVVYPDWINAAAQKIRREDWTFQGGLLEQFIAEAYAEAQPRQVYEDYRELFESFAHVVFQIMEPGNQDVLTSAPDKMQFLSGYFHSQPRAHHALTALVSLAMRQRERWGWSPTKRQNEDARQEALTLKAMYDLGLMTVGQDT